MIIDTFEQILQALVAFGYALPRLLAMFAMIPVLSRQALPGILRTGVVAAIAVMVVPTLLEPVRVLQLSTLETMFVLGKEVLLGTGLGFVVAVPLWAFDAMGSFVDNQRGASIAQTINPMTGHDSSPLGEMFSQAAVTYLVASGGLLLLLDATYRSYDLWPVFDLAPRLTDETPVVLLGQLDRLMHLAVLLGAPVLVSMLIAEMGLALVSRFAPQLQVFFLAMPIKSAVALFVFSVYAITLFDQGGVIITDMKRALDVFGKVVPPQGAR
jgi:type III secretion protein T